MPAIPMTREGNPETITIGVTAGASTEIDMSRFAGGSFELPATSGTTQITFYAQVGSEPYGVMTDEDGVDVPARAVTASVPNAFPSCAYNFPRIKLVASAGTATVGVPIFIKS